MKKYTVIMTIAGSDSGGGAGIQADLKTIEALGGYGTSVISAITAQNTQGVNAIHPIPTDIILKQFEAIAEDMEISALKTGMLHNSETIEVVSECIKKYGIKKVVVDPVMISTSGHKLIEDNTIKTLKTKLIPLAEIITPNLDEAEVLLNKKIATPKDMEEASLKLMDLGCKCALVKGGHLTSENIVDVYYNLKKEQAISIESKKINTLNTHGTGCTLSAAIATMLGKNYNLDEAILKSHNYLYGALLSGKDYKLGKGFCPLHHSYQNNISDN